MIQFVIGLGNPGEKYKNSPHNLGRRLVEHIQKKEHLIWKKGKWFENTVSVPAYVRLNTFMNLSGEGIVQLLNQFNCAPDKLLICYDDFDLPFGTIRIREKGSAGSHQGLKSIVKILKTFEFPRLRLGIGPLPKNQDPADFVLRPFSDEQETIVEQMVEKASEAVQIIVSEGLEPAMNRFNSTPTSS